MRPPGMYIRSLGLVSWSVGGAYAPGGVCICSLEVHIRPLGVYFRPLGVYIRSLGLVSWTGGVAFPSTVVVRPLGGCISVHWVRFRGVLGVHFGPGM